MGRRLDQFTNLPTGSDLAGTDYIVGYRPGALGIRFTLSTLLTKIATSLVTSVFGRIGDVVAQPGDYTASDITGLGNSATLDVGTTAGTVAAGDHGHSSLTMDYVIFRNETTGTLWKLELTGDTDASTQPTWTPQ